MLGKTMVAALALSTLLCLAACETAAPARAAGGGGGGGGAVEWARAAAPPRGALARPVIGAVPCGRLEARAVRRGRGSGRRA